MPEGADLTAGQPTKISVAVRSSRPGIKSVAILDEEALLAAGIYIDLNPVAAKIAEVPETSEYTSIKQRVDHIKAEDGRLSSKRPKPAAWRARVRRAVWRRTCGCARSRIDGGWIVT